VQLIHNFNTNRNVSAYSDYTKICPGVVLFCAVKQTEGRADSRFLQLLCERA